jgi:DNA-binding transcriptional regulator LsrR (DeoR family)
MPVDIARRKLLYKVAMAYYEDDQTQDEIARRFGLSRIKISRLLRQARQEKVVHIAVFPPLDAKPDLERRLEAAFGLSEVVVVSPPSYDAPTLVRELGQAAAEFLVRGLQGDEVVGISWGTTLRAVIDELPAQSWPDLKVVQLIGGLGRAEAETHGADLTRRMAEAFDARPIMLSAPGIVASRAVRDALLTDPQISETLALAAGADVALVGLGAPTPNAVVTQLGGILSAGDIEQIKVRGGVGDIALRFFNREGRAIDDDINARIIGLDLEQIKAIRRVIGVAGGEEKLDVICAALRGRLISVLVTDERTAHRLLGEGD